ncbi:hypothetical protein CEXT_298781 [Caerostris extrusa]|uniref:Uncharacterized protein n=1 Tax=Caerostris extrusa TaxID=172846 RepID=A0AAV4YDH7_CAEEX|nr:hypothetical protein CEXT_298781 [Caerostris extrusa]
MNKKNDFHHFQVVTHNKETFEEADKIEIEHYYTIGVGVTFIAVKKSFLDKYSTYDTFNRNEEELWNCNNTEDRKLFLNCGRKGIYLFQSIEITL